MSKHDVIDLIKADIAFNRTANLDIAVLLLLRVLKSKLTLVLSLVFHDLFEYSFL